MSGSAILTSAFLASSTLGFFFLAVLNPLANIPSGVAAADHNEDIAIGIDDQVIVS